MLRITTVLFSLLCLSYSHYHCFSDSPGQTYDWLYQYDTGITFNQVGFNPYKDGSVIGRAAINIPNYGGANGGDGSSRTLFSNLFTRSNYLSARMTGIYTATSTQTFNTTVRCDDGCRWWVDGKLHVDIWKSSDIFFETETWRSLSVVAGQNYTFSFEWFETTSKEGFQLLSDPPGIGAGVKACIEVLPYKATTCPLAPRGLKGEFFENGIDFTGLPAATFDVVDTNDILDFTYNDGTYPYGTNLGGSGWGVRYSGLFVAPFSGDFYFWATKIEYTRVKVGESVVLEFGSHREQVYRKGGPTVRLLAGKAYSFEVLFRNLPNQPSGNIASMTWGFSNGDNSFTFDYNMLRACKPYAVVAPETVVVNSFESTPIPIVLSLPPSGPVNVTFTLDSGVSVSPCILYFTPDNWNVTQYIYAKTTITNTKIYYVAVGYEYTEVESTPTTLTYNAPSMITKTCTSWGDPHFVTFSGSKFDFFGTGVFYLYRTLDSSFVVQASHYHCGKASCNGGFAIRYYSAVVIVTLDGNLPKYYQSNQVDLVIGYVKTDIPNGYKLQFPNGVTAVITLSYWASGKTYYMNIDLSVPQSMQGLTRGLCGTYDSIKNNDYVLPDGTITDLQTFTESWRVPISENLFDDNLALIGPLPGAPNTGSPTTILTNCSIPVPPPEDRPPFNPPPSANCTDPITLEEAQEYCLILFNTSSRAIDCAKQGVDTNTLYNNCVDEVYLLCDQDAAIPAYDQLIKECPGVPEECPGDCYLNGKCTGSGCVCNPGFILPDCKPFQCPSTFSISPQSGEPGTTVYLTGSNFDNGQVYTCHFEGNVDVEAVIVDAFTAYCIVPLDAQGAVVPVNLVKDGKDCSDNPPTFTYTTGITECPSGDGFGTIPVGTDAVVYDCDENEYGNRTKGCTDRAKTTPVEDNCHPCPPLATSPANSATFDQCQCPPGYVLEDGSCNKYEVVTPPDVCATPGSPATIPVHLSRKPSTTVTVTFVFTSSLTVSVCQLTFTPDNYDANQNLYVNAYQTGGKIEYISSGGQYDTAINLPTNVCLTPSPIEPYRVCVSWGDPHIITFSKTQYDAQLNNTVYLYKSPDGSFVVQGLHFFCAPGLACNHAIAIRYHSAVAIVSLQEKSWSLYQSEVNALYPGYKVLTYKSRAEIFFPNMYQVTVTYNYWALNKVNYLSAYIYAPAYLEGTNTRGLCGTYDSNQSNDFVLRDETVVAKSELSSFINSWIVPTAESIFEENGAVIPGSQPYVLKTYSNCSTSVIVAPRPPIREPTSTGETQSCSLSSTEIEEFCAKNFLVTCSDPIVDAQTFYDNCITEVTAACDFSAAGPAANAFQQVCPIPDSIPCDDNCNFHGVCVNGVCDCDAGFDLPTCTVPDCPDTVSVSPSSGSPGDIITVSGAGFAGYTNYQCSFDGDLVTAKFIDASTVTCTTPLNFKGKVVSVNVLADSNTCTANAPTFTYTVGVADCPADSGFPITSSNSMSQVTDCPANSYGSRSRTCSLYGDWSSITNNCQSCPPLSSSSAGTPDINGCSCPSGYSFDGTNCIDINECFSSNGGCDSQFGICKNTPGSRTCECVAGFTGNGITCSPDASTTLVTPWRPIARFLFRDNLIDSSGNNRTITNPLESYVPFYMRGVPTNRAIRMRKNGGMVTSLLPIDQDITITTIFNIQQLVTFTLIQLQPTDDLLTPFTNSYLSVEVTSTGKLLYRNFGAVVGSTKRYFLTGKSYFVVFGIRGGKVVTFIDNVQIGTFNLPTPNGSSTLRLLTMKNLEGFFDEISVYDEPVFANSPFGFLELSSLVRCNNACTSPAVCYNTATSFTCGTLLASQP